MSDIILFYPFYKFNICLPMFFFIFTRIPTYYIIMVITQKYFVKVDIYYIEVQACTLTS